MINKIKTYFRLRRTEKRIAAFKKEAERRLTLGGDESQELIKLSMNLIELLFEIQVLKKEIWFFSEESLRKLNRNLEKIGF